MKVTELDTKEVKVTRTEKRYILDERVFELDSCPFWAQYAAVDACGKRTGTAQSRRALEATGLTFMVVSV